MTLFIKTTMLCTLALTGTLTPAAYNEGLTLLKAVKTQSKDKRTRLIIDALRRKSRTEKLFKAIEQGDPQKIQDILDQLGPRSINEVENQRGHTPLVAATYKANPATIHLLLDNKADINAACRAHGLYRVTPLLQAISQTDAAIVELLLGRNADIEAFGSTPQDTPVNSAFQRNDPSTLLTLLAYNPAIPPQIYANFLPDRHQKTVNALIDHAIRTGTIKKLRDNVLLESANGFTGRCAQRLIDNRVEETNKMIVPYVDELGSTYGKQGIFNDQNLVNLLSLYLIVPSYPEVTYRGH